MNEREATCDDRVNQCFALRLSPEMLAWVKQICEQGAYLWQEIAVAVSRLLTGDQALKTQMDTTGDLSVRLAKRRLHVDLALFATWPAFLKKLLNIRPHADAELISHVFAEFLAGIVNNEETLKRSVAGYRVPSIP